VIAAQTGSWFIPRKSAKLHDYGQVGIAGHLTIGNNVRIQAQSGVGRNIKDDEILQGSPYIWLQ
jgi:UDP-3-O-[3-hydroxymyristoyl] glucosamine N-acyltransferase